MRFTIIKGQPFSCTIQIKAPSSITGLPLDPTDTATFTLSGIEAPKCIYIDKHPMSIENALEGKFLLELTSEQTSDLPSVEGFVEDSARPMVTCKGLVVANTASEGQIIGNIPSIYIDDFGELECTN